MREEYAAALIQANNEIQTNPSSLLDWLLHPAKDGKESVVNRDEAKRLRLKAFQAFDSRLAEISNADLHPESRQLVNAGWINKP
jgi:hypothetical protein